MEAKDDHTAMERRWKQLETLYRDLSSQVGQPGETGGQEKKVAWESGTDGRGGRDGGRR